MSPIIGRLKDDGIHKGWRKAAGTARSLMALSSHRLFIGVAPSRGPGHGNFLLPHHHFGTALPRLASVRCKREELADTVADQLETREPFDVVEVRDDKDVLVLTIAGDIVAFSD